MLNNDERKQSLEIIKPMRRFIDNVNFKIKHSDGLSKPLKTTPQQALLKANVGDVLHTNYGAVTFTLSVTVNQPIDKTVIKNHLENSGWQGQQKLAYSLMTVSATKYLIIFSSDRVLTEELSQALATLFSPYVQESLNEIDGYKFTVKPAFKDEDLADDSDNSFIGVNEAVASLKNQLKTDKFKEALNDPIESVNILRSIAKSRSYDIYTNEDVEQFLDILSTEAKDIKKQYQESKKDVENDQLIKSNAYLFGHYLKVDDNTQNNYFDESNIKILGDVTPIGKESETTYIDTILMMNALIEATTATTKTMTEDQLWDQLQYNIGGGKNPTPKILQDEGNYEALIKYWSQGAIRYNIATEKAEISRPVTFTVNYTTLDGSTKTKTLKFVPGTLVPDDVSEDKSAKDSHGNKIQRNISNWTTLLDALSRFTGKYTTQKVDIKAVKNAVPAVAQLNTYDPARMYLAATPKWDKVPRFKQIFGYVGAPDTDLTQYIARNMAINNLNLMLANGFKADMCIDLGGDQGVGKTTLIEKLFNSHDQEGTWTRPNLGWYTSSLETWKGKDAKIGMLGKYVVNDDEMVTSDQDSKMAGYLKRIISQSQYDYRSPYKEGNASHPRRQAFFRTTNTMENLYIERKATRKFYPIYCRESRVKWSIDDLTEYKVDQYWSEALRYYINNLYRIDDLVRPSDAQEKALEELRSVSMYTDMMESDLRDIIADLIDESSYNTNDPLSIPHPEELKITTEDIKGNLEIKTSTKQEKRFAVIMRETFGFTSKRIYIDGKKKSGYIATDKTEHMIKMYDRTIKGDDGATIKENMPKGKGSAD